ncbi:MAG: pentapeptide repeat-containing protein [Bacteroidota bacterium]|nr:pentapeptide repeat-containing protein [Bacteroidota bacterium]
MADPYKIAKIKESVTEWNRSRIDHPDDYVDLKEADLSGMDLSRANFYGADLAGANLRGTALFRLCRCSPPPCRRCVF